MTISARYTPPPSPPPGIVTITLNDDEANKLRALLGKCNGLVFDRLYNAIHSALDHPSAPKQLYLNYVNPTPAEVRCIDLNTTFKFSNDHLY